MNANLIAYLNKQIEDKELIVKKYEKALSNLNELKSLIDEAEEQVNSFGDIETIKKEIYELSSYIEELEKQDKASAPLAVKPLINN